MAQLISNREWKKLLRAGEIKQGRSMWNQKEQSACVLGQLAIRSGFMKLRDGAIRSYNYDGFTLAISLGQGKQTGRFPPDWAVGLVFMNDEWGYSLDEIADFIPDEDDGPYPILPKGKKIVAIS